MLELLLLAVALAMDAFAVALVRGAAGEHRLLRALEVGLAFGIAQGLMPLGGWLLGEIFAEWIAAFDHWIAFLLLAFLGARMILAALSGEDQQDPAPIGRASHFLGLLVAAIATSIDAAAAGLTLDLFATPVLLSCLVIGVVTALLCAPAYWFASRIGLRFGHLAEGFGGVVLIGLGMKILLEHLA